MSRVCNQAWLARIGRCCFIGGVALLCACQPLGAKPVPRGDDQEIKLVDGIDRFERHVFLPQADLGGGIIWIDDRRILALVPGDPRRNAGQPELPLSTWVVIDTETGTVAALPWRRTKEEMTEVVCYHPRSGRIVVKQRIERGEKLWDMRWLMGTFGQELKIEHDIKDTLTNGDWPKSWADKQLGFAGDCRLVSWPEQLPQKGHPEYLQHMEEGHGWLHAENFWPTDGVDGIFHYIHPDGRRFRIPITGGEREIRASRYYSFADAYLLVPVLNYSSPHHVWTPHYVRLLHPNGPIERFPVPDPIMRRITLQQGSGAAASAQLTRRGLLWFLHLGDRDPDLATLTGNYLSIGNKLVRVGQNVGNVSPDGCKLLGYSELSRFQLLTPGTRGPFDYFTIDLCKEIQP